MRTSVGICHFSKSLPHSRSADLGIRQVREQEVFVVWLRNYTCGTLNLTLQRFFQWKISVVCMWPSCDEISTIEWARFLDLVGVTHILFPKAKGNCRHLLQVMLWEMMKIYWTPLVKEYWDGTLLNIKGGLFVVHATIRLNWYLQFD